MATVTLSSKNQITLPVEMVRALDLKAGDKIVVELINGRLVLLPQPENWTDYFSGSVKGLWGATVQDVDRHLEELRYGDTRQEWHEEVEDLFAGSEHARKIVRWLKGREGMRAEAREFQDFCESQRLEGAMIPGEGAFSQLVQLGVLRRLPRTDVEEYRLVRDALAPKWRQQLDDLLAVDPDARKVIEGLRQQPNYASSGDRLYGIPGIHGERLAQVIDKLLELGALRSLPGAKRAYRLRSELVRAEE